MPQLNPLYIRVEAEDGKTRFEYDAGVYVTKSAEFHVDLDERLADIAEKLNHHPYGVSINYSRSKNWKVEGKGLAQIADFIRACAKDFLACEKTTERVIVYGHEIHVAIWQDGKDLYSNGSGRDRKGKWFIPANAERDLDSNRPVPFYAVGLAAAVYDKVTWKRKSGNTVNWERVRGEAEDSPIDLLNSFTCLSVDPDCERYQKIPYTPEAAIFFYKMMLSLCRLAIELDSFFSSPQKLASAISEGRLLNAPPPAVHA